MSSMTRIGAGEMSLEEIRSQLETGTLNTVREFLTDARIVNACRDAGLVYRKRTLTPKVTALHMVLSGLWPQASFAAAWQVLWDFMVSRCPAAAGESPSSGSLSKARQRLPVAFWDRLFHALALEGQRLSTDLDLWHGHRVVLLDGTCVSMPDAPELAEAFGRSGSPGRPGRFPLARVATTALANTMTVLSYAAGPYRRDENHLAQGLLKELRPGDLVVADRHFAGAARYAGFLEHGLDFLTRTHQRQIVERLPRLFSFGPDDFVTDLPIISFYRHRDRPLPETVRVRMIRAVMEVRGKTGPVWLTTSLLDPERYPAAEVVALYRRRWRIETLFDEAKVKMSADVLRSRSPEGVLKELAARMMAVNLVRMTALRAARRSGEDPLRISFTAAARAIIDFAPAMASAPAWKLPEIYNAMLTEIASHLVPERPGRHEPRARRRAPPAYPTLRTTRRLWRLHHAA